MWIGKEKCISKDDSMKSILLLVLIATSAPASEDSFIYSTRLSENAIDIESDTVVCCSTTVFCGMLDVKARVYNNGAYYVEFATNENIEGKDTSIIQCPTIKMSKKTGHLLIYESKDFVVGYLQCLRVNKKGILMWNEVEGWLSKEDSVAYSNSEYDTLLREREIR